MKIDQRRWTACGSAMLLLLAGASLPAVQQGLGYQDTPLIPGTKWHVHDGQRPQPRVVTPGKTFSDLAPPPVDAVRLFTGNDLSSWQQSRGGEAQWPVVDGFFSAQQGGAIRTKESFADFQLHLEFATPEHPAGSGQSRGNSGVLINGMYEVQILDSYQNPTYPDGQCGALYGQMPPRVNACRPPGEWQTYDVIFESPRWNERGELIRKAAVTVLHNGLVLHHRQEFLGGTDGIGSVPHKSLAAYTKPHPPEVFIELQDHGNPLRYRNIWIRELGSYDQAE